MKENEEPEIKKIDIQSFSLDISKNE